VSNFKCGVNNCVLDELLLCLMSDLDLCDVCWSFVGMSTSSIVKNIKIRS
jgi:hypothetical protein